MADADFDVAIRLRLDQGNIGGQLSAGLGALKGQVTGMDGELTKVQNALNGVGAAGANMGKNLSTTRYALYDVASTLTAISAAALALPVASATVAIQWERDFANVIRTSQLSGDSIDSMRQKLVGLAQTMPIAFGDVTKIATLAGQLGIAEERVESFTRTVVKFATISGVSVEKSATAFGRLDALLPDVNGQFEKLGSSIAKVAVESVSTEDQIITIATQISSMGAYAGLTADQVVGLSGALASVGTQPELARGTVTRLFTLMGQAVSDGGEKLDRFGKLAGVSGDLFAKSFGTERFGPILRSFIEGLADVDRTGGDAIKTLNDLGITSVRDVPALTRLAQAGDVLAESFANARTGFSEGGELTRQYGIIAETTASKITILGNNFQAFLATLGSSTSGPINAAVDGLTTLLKIMTDIAATPAGQGISLVVLSLSAMVGVISLVGAGIAVAMAGTIAMSQALSGMGIAAGTSGTMLSILQGQLMATGAAGTFAARGLGLAVIALKGLVVAAAAVAGMGVASFITQQWSDMAYEIEGKSKDVDSAFKRVVSSGEEARHYFIRGWQADMQRAFAPLSNTTFLRDIEQVDSAIADLAKNGNVDAARAKLQEIRTAWTQAGFEMGTFDQVFTDAMRSIEEAGNIETNPDQFGELNAQMDEMARQAAEAEAAIEGLGQALLNINGSVVGQSQALINQASAMNAMAVAAEDADASLTGTNDASLQLQGAMIGVETASLAAAKAIIDNGGSIEAATGAYNAGRAAIDAAAAAKAGDAAAGAAWADSTVGSADRARQGIVDYHGAVNATPTAHNLNATNNAGAAQGPVDSYANAIFRVPTYRYTLMEQEFRSVYTVVNRGGAGAGPGMANYGSYATGGPIFGPGSGTSDSIPAWLSNGEYVINSRAAAFYGRGMMNAINSMKAPKFAGGGPVGEHGLGGIIELGPKSLGRMGGGVNVNVMLDEVGLSRAVQRGDAKRRAAGDYRA